MWAGALIVMGFRQNIVSYPILQGKMINVAAFVYTPGREGTVYNGPWAAPVTAEEVAKHYASWDPAVPRLLKVRVTYLPV